MTRVADYLLWGSGTAGRRSPGVRLGSLAGVHESPLIGETAVIGRGGTTSRARGGWSRMIMMATKMRRDSI